MTTEIDKKRKNSIVLAIIILLIIFTLIGGMAIIYFFLPTAGFGIGIPSILNSIFALDSTQTWWFVTRSSGILAYLLIWFSTIYGLAIPSRLLSPALEQNYTFDFHEFISLLSIGFLIVHVLVLLVDQYMPYTLVQILIPFLSPYRPFWVGVGVISFYLILLVTITFYIRNKIGSSTFRAIHLLSLISYIGATLHGLYAGTDSPLAAMQLLYKGSAFVVTLLTFYYIYGRVIHNINEKKKTIPHQLQTSQAFENIIYIIFYW